MGVEVKINRLIRSIVEEFSMGVVTSKFSSRSMKDVFSRIPLEVLTTVVFSYMDVRALSSFKNVNKCFAKSIDIHLRGRRLTETELAVIMKSGIPEHMLSMFVLSNSIDLRVYGDQVVLYAISKNYISLIKVLLSKIEEMEISDKLLDKLFNSAIYRGRTKIVEAFLGTDRVNPANRSNWPIQTACEKGFSDIVRVLNDSEKVDITSHRNYCIRAACERGHVSLVKYLLSIPDVDPTDHSNAAIGYSAENGHLDVVKVLLNDERVEASAEHNYALRGAAVHGHVEVVKLLLCQEDTDPTEFSNYALRYSAARGHYNVVKVLMSCKEVREDEDGVGKAFESCTDKTTRRYLKKYVKKIRRKRRRRESRKSKL